MKNTKRSITLKVISGYILLTALAVFAVWFIYGQIQTISSDTEVNNRNNQKLFLITEAATKLFIAEGISKEIIQNQNVNDLPFFKAEIDSVGILIDSLKTLSQEAKMKRELDSVSTLLQFKTRNLEELLELRARGTTESYYAKVINRLQKVDDYFEDDSNLDPLVRRAL
ncbi:MAG: hybrid sensor histidine kinase/response regulator, partial [Flavobacteriales bacterium]|nr:hybrid sensor histidine kinase/response regulator [Flavobacteriales bacterium]